MKREGWIIVIALLVVIFIGVSYQLRSAESITAPAENEETIMQAATYIDVSAAEAKDLIDNNPNLIVIDVSPHWAEGHLPRAISYYPSSALQKAIPKLDKDATYLVYCHADGPSRAGAQALIDAGFTKVYRLESHFGGWQAVGYPVEK